MINKKSIFMITFVLLLQIAVAIEPNGCRCQYESMDVDFILNDDGSIDTTIRISCLLESRKDSRRYSTVQTIPLPDNEIIDPKSIKIVDLHNPEREFTPTGMVGINRSNCTGKYTFSPTTNDIEFCIQTTKEDALHYEIKYRYNAKNYSTKDKEKYGRVSRNIVFGFPQSNETYALSFSESCSEKLRCEFPKSCPQPSTELIPWEYLPLENGIECRTDSYAPNQSKRMIVFDLSGTLKSFIEKEAEKERLKQEEEKRRIERLDVEKRENRDKVRDIINTLIVAGYTVVAFLVLTIEEFKNKLKYHLDYNRKILKIAIIIFVFLYILLKFDTLFELVGM